MFWSNYSSRNDIIFNGQHQLWKLSSKELTGLDFEDFRKRRKSLKVAMMDVFTTHGWRSYASIEAF